MNGEPTLRMLLKSFRLPAFVTHCEELARSAEREGLNHEQCLHNLAQLEAHERHDRKIALLLRQSRLPLEKTLATFEVEGLPSKIRALLPTLCEGSFLSRAESILAFGNPGSGKTHLLCAIAHHWIYGRTAPLLTPRDSCGGCGKRPSGKLKCNLVIGLTLAANFEYQIECWVLAILARNRFESRFYRRVDC